MDPRVRQQLRGFVLNKFRGDETLLAPAPEQLRALTGVPTLAVLPMDRHHGLPEEDGVFEEDTQAAVPGGLTLGIVAPPHISNLDEFQPLRQLPGVRLRWVRDATAARAADWLILPGSKHTRADLAWLRQQQLDAAIAAHVQAGRPLLAICGGLQMLGQEVVDAQGYEGASPGRTPGLGLLPLRTEFAVRKQLRHTRARFGRLAGPWAALSGIEVQGYEIRAGRTTTCTPCDTALPDGLGWQQGPVLALYLHGLFENPSVQQALFGTHTAAWDDGFDRLAQQLEQRFTHQGLMQLL
jgi:adenosylcobyric acid synthase